MGKLIAIAAVLVLWQIIAISPIADGGLPTPVEVLQALIGLWGNQHLLGRDRHHPAQHGRPGWRSAR